MEKYKRAKRRKDLAKKVKQRVKRNGGEYYYWMKWTSTPCSCGMCSGYKYKYERAKEKRNASKEILREIEEEILREIEELNNN
jgi:hypothetical protein